jgi:hypothetical protein
VTGRAVELKTLCSRVFKRYVSARFLNLEPGTDYHISYVRVKSFEQSFPMVTKTMFDILYILFIAIKCVSFMLVGVPEHMEQI